MNLELHREFENVHENWKNWQIWKLFVIFKKFMKLQIKKGKNYRKENKKLKKSDKMRWKRNPHKTQPSKLVGAEIMGRQPTSTLANDRMCAPYGLASIWRHKCQIGFGNFSLNKPAWDVLYSQLDKCPMRCCKNLRIKI